MKYILTVFILICMGYCLSAQLRPYTNANPNLSFNNPSMVGHDGGSHLRFGISDQLSSASRTAMNGNIQFDKGIQLGKNILGYAVGVAMDSNGLLKSVSANFAGAYHYKFGIQEHSTQYLSFGTRLDIQRMSVMKTEFLTSTVIGHNWTVGTFNDPFISGLNLAEDFSPFYKIGLDVGGTYSYVTDNKEYLKVGIAIQDINGPRKSFSNGDSITLDRSFTTIISGRVLLADNISILPQFQYFNGLLATSFIMSSSLSYNIGKTSFLVGLGYGESGFYTCQLGAEFSKFGISANYNWGGEASIFATVFKALELTMIYKLSPINKKT